jgi:hypothetical protein
LAAGPEQDRHWLPGSLPDVWRVTLDWALPRERCRAVVTPEGQISIAASGYPRPIPGVPPERNLLGLSFAVANATGLVAALFDGEAADSDPCDVVSRAIARGWGRG